MLGIEAIGSYVPADRISNYDRKEQFGIDDHFIEEKIGVRSVSRKSPEEETSDLCVKAYADLLSRTSINPADIDLLVVVTQNPDTNIPHTSAIVHGRLGLPDNCACFDISLGCSGFVYSLAIVHSLMSAQGMKRGLLFTADPYSKVVDPNDKNTALLFGDGAAVTLLGPEPRLVPGRFTFGTTGSEHEKLICKNGPLFMNGRAVFNFAAKVIPPDIERMAGLNGMKVADIDRFFLHQGSRIIVETIAKKLGIEVERAPYRIHDYGNTISSTIPLLLQEELESDKPARTMAISGFGVGLSWSSGLLLRV